MRHETITDEQDLLIRRLVLEPGESTPWHTDRCRRFTVVVSGTELSIEFAGGDEAVVVPVGPGLADWDEPTDVVHRAVNVGAEAYEEIVTFFRSDGEEPQPPPDA